MNQIIYKWETATEAEMEMSLILSGQSEVPISLLNFPVSLLVGFTLWSFHSKHFPQDAFESWS